VCCSVLQYAAVCCILLQCVAECFRTVDWMCVCCSVWQCVAVCCSVLQCVSGRQIGYARTPHLTLGLCCSVLQCVAVYYRYCSVLQQCLLQCVAAVCCSSVNGIAVCCNSVLQPWVLQCVAAVCCSNVLQQQA